MRYNFSELPLREWRFYAVPEADKRKFRKAVNAWCSNQPRLVTIECRQLMRIDSDGNKVFFGFDVYKNN